MPKQTLSEHLRREERNAIEKLLEKEESQSKSMGIAEIALSSTQDIVTNDSIQTFDWKPIVKPGIVCLVQKTKNEDYFIEAFNLDLDSGHNQYTQKIDLNMKYRRPRRHIIMFDGVLGKVCLNFVDDDEADFFVSTLAKITSK